MKARIVGLPGVTAAPDTHYDEQEGAEHGFDASGSIQESHIQSAACRISTWDFASPEQSIVERARAYVEDGEVDVVELVGEEVV